MVSNSIFSLLRLVSLIVVVGVLQGCLAMQADIEPEYTEENFPSDSSPPSSGAIFHSGRAFVLFDDIKAHNVGDILTVVLVERTDAINSSSTTTSKATNVEAPGPTVFGRPVTIGGTAILEAQVSSANSFTGEGASSQSNRLTGSVSVTVIHRYANGNLRVQGKKHIALNQGKEYVSVSGIVRPADIDSRNSITSDRIADSRISYSGSGPLANANAMGPIARFFNAPWSILKWPFSS